MTPKRTIYLQMKSVQESRRLFFERISFDNLLGREIIPAHEAVNRTTAEPIFARFSAPTYHAAAMDGIAVRAEDTFGTTVDKPKRLVVGKDTVYVNTGQPLPEGTNAVIMIEQVLVLDQTAVQIESSAYPWQHVRRVGEDIVATELILPQNHRISAYEVGALLNGGIFSLPVKQKPLVGLIPTGSELKSPSEIGETLPFGQVIESNSAVLSALIKQWGGKCTTHAIVEDDYQKILNTVRQAVRGDAHIVVVSAGSSAGSADYTANVIRELGEVLVHGVTMMPGKPTVLGLIDGKPVLGNPGYTVSAIMALETFVKPLICRMLGIRPNARPRTPVLTARKIASKLGLDDFIRVKVGQVNDTLIATPLPRGAGSVTTLTEADGILKIPSDTEGLQAGETTHVELLRDLEDIQNTVVVIGSHDNSLDLLANHMRSQDWRYGLSSSNVGSLGGLMALRNGHCHVAGCHLLDTETGTYNIPYITKYLQGHSVTLIHLVYRDQGLIVPKGNPKSITGMEDLVKGDVTFINRQGGSGTRILLDHRLKALGIDPKNIHGYDQEEFTHMAVAVAVLSGAADTGLGIFAAAKALDLDFVPVVTEQYDLVIPEPFLREEKVAFMLEVVRSDSFKKEVIKLGGYDTSDTGSIIASL